MGSTTVGTAAGGESASAFDLTSAGAFASSLAFGDVGEQNAGRIVVDASGNRYVTGTFVGTIDLGDGPLLADTLSDVFVAKLAP